MQQSLKKDTEQLTPFIEAAMHHIMEAEHGLSDAINLRESVTPILSATTPRDELITVLSALDESFSTTHQYTIRDRDRVLKSPFHVEPAFFNKCFPHGLSRSQIILYDAVMFKINSYIYDLVHYDHDARQKEVMSEEDITQLSDRCKKLQKEATRIFLMQLSRMELIDFSQSDHNHSDKAATH